MQSRLARTIELFAADAPRLAQAQAQAVRAHFSAYRAGRVPEAALVASGRYNVAQVTAILRSGRPPRSDALDEARRTRERASQGVPADEMHDAYRLCLRILGEAFVSTATATRLSQREMLGVTRLLWESADILTSAVVTARAAVERDRSHSERDARAAFLNGLVLGTTDPRALPAALATHGLALDRSYYVVRARARVALDEAALAARLEPAVHGHKGRPLIGRVDGDVVGLCASLPVCRDARFTLGVGGPQTLDALPRAFAQASRMLDVALHFGLSGTCDLGTLGVRVAVAAEPELGALLVARYLAPLRAAGEFGGILERTVRTHLETGGRLVETARRLHIHVNSVRHRLARFEALTGVDLVSVTAQVELWWALQWAAYEQSAPGGTP